VLVAQLAHLPLLGLVLPRALEVVGMAYLLNAVNKFGTDEDADLKADLANVATKAGDAVRKLAGK
jgi:hypothetical protein